MNGELTATTIPIVALAGNPNAGKTSLFNALTGLNQKVGNYPGVTVERAVGTASVGNLKEVHFIDSPGLYSLIPVSVDEEVAVSELTSEDSHIDVIVCVIDVNNLERNLFLYSHLADLGIPLVVALTMTDVAARNGSKINTEALEIALGVQVVSVISHKNVGLTALKSAIERQIFEPKIAPPVGKERGSTIDLSTEERYSWASVVREQVVTNTMKDPVSRTRRIDAVLTHRVFGVAIFLAIMFAVFQSIYSLAKPMMSGIGWVFDKLGEAVSSWIPNTPWLKSLIVEGLIKGVGTVATFLPQILILFFFIAALEGTGYMARAAFLMDKLLGWCGLSGRAFIPLLSSYACAIPGIMAARVMPDSKSRLATILVAPLMSCSARLPVYVLLIGAFIEPKYGAIGAGIAMFAMHFVGLAYAIPVVLFINKKMLRQKHLPFIMELPQYQWPKWKDVWHTMWTRAKVFMQTAGTIIVVMSIAIWALIYFPRNAADANAYRQAYSQMPTQFREHTPEENFVEAKYRENSYLGRFGRTIEPAFLPAGFDWRITTAILSAFPAREVVVSATGIVFSQGESAEDKDLGTALSRATWPDGRPLFTTWTAIGLMVFFALCCQCMATLATVRRETNSWKWPLFMFTYMTGLAWISAVVIHQIAVRFGG